MVVGWMVHLHMKGRKEAAYNIAYFGETMVSGKDVI